MGHLELRFDKQQPGIDVDLGVVARVRQIRDAEGRFPADPEDREVVIPAGAHARRRLDDIPAGTYRIEAQLPSGEVLRQTLEVTDDPHPAEAIFKDHDPQDWLSWQRFAGNVPSQKEFEGWMTNLAENIVRAAKAKQDAARQIQIDEAVVRGFTTKLRNLRLKIMPGLKWLGKIVAKAGGSILTNYSGGGADWAPVPSGSLPAPQVDAESAEFELVQADPRAPGLLWEAVTSLPAWTAWRENALRYDGCRASKKVDRSLTLWQIEQVASCSVAGLPVRCLAVMRRGDGVDVITLPIPWPLDSNEPPARLEILREAGISEIGRTTVTVRDERVGSLIVYLNNGQMSNAATMLAEAKRTGLVESLISEKFRNPLAACAAAYVGLATLSGDEKPDWGLWLQNLKIGFKWLPDGAIVHAAYLIRTAKTRDDLDSALGSLKDAYRRGIPFYTAGLRHLMNGLYTFSTRDDEAKVMYERVSTVASRVDPNQAFNQITIPAPLSQ